MSLIMCSKNSETRTETASLTRADSPTKLVSLIRGQKAIVTEAIVTEAIVTEEVKSELVKSELGDDNLLSAQVSQTDIELTQNPPSDPSDDEGMRIKRLTLRDDSPFFVFLSRPFRHSAI